MSTAAVPDALLTPLLDVAADLLRGLQGDDVPAALRPLAGFDRRGLTSATARRQLRRTFDVDESFRERVVEAFTARPEVRAALDGWTPATAVAKTADAAERDDLGVLTSALYAARPDGFEFGLGVACGEERRRRIGRTLHDDARAQTMRLATAEEARRRAEDALDGARADAARFESELREERRGRHDARESAADRQAAEAARSAREAEAALDKARRDLGLAETRTQREAERAREAERRLRELKREGAPPPPAPPEPDRRILDDLVRRARDLADMAGRLAVPPPVSTPPPAPAPASSVEPGRRAPVPCPPGLHHDQPEGLDAMFRVRGVVLVVDGYNVSMAGWPSASVANQREQLIAAFARLHLRLRCDVVVVFDGADVEGVVPRRTPGVRVVFSPAGEAADPVVIREVAALPLRAPVLVVSSDAWVRDHTVDEGATPVASAVLLEVLRR